MTINCQRHGLSRAVAVRASAGLTGGVTAKALTKSLRTLERDGLVHRVSHPGPVRRVEYALTPLGRSLLEPMAAACAWAQEHWEELLDAREAVSSR